MKTISNDNSSASAVVLAHDALTQFGGAERVLTAAIELFPQSSLYSLAVDRKVMAEKINDWNVVSSPLQWIYDFYPKFTHLFAFIPVVLKFWKPKSGRLLLSFSSSYIKGLQKPKGSVHINYCHTPTRFLWVDPQHAYKEIPKLLHPFTKVYFSWLKRWDLNAAKKVDYFIANSKEVQGRIKQVYGRESEIIYPFVDTEFWHPTEAKQNYFLIAGRLQYAKGLETVIAAFNELGWPLHVVGTGRYEEHLKGVAKENIKFLGHVSDEVLRNQYSGARGFIYPQFEDFGLMPLESAGCGTATLGLAKGGSLETILPGQTGELLSEITIQSLTQALKDWDERKYNQQVLRNHAAQFSKQIFQNKLTAVIQAHGNDRN